MHIHVEGHLSEDQKLDREGHAVCVTIIRGGTSKNGYAYSEDALQSIAGLVEGAHAYADHGRSEADATTRSVRDIVGFYHDAQYIAPAAHQQYGRVDATLHLFEAASWLWSLIQEAYSVGRPELIGLSVDIFGTWQMNEASKAKEVTHIVSLNSCDIVTRPSAGGAFRRILHTEGATLPMLQESLSEPTQSTTHEHRLHLLRRLLRQLQRFPLLYST